jgi:epoxyqueuosine reductase QueG
VQTRPRRDFRLRAKQGLSSNEQRPLENDCGALGNAYQSEVKVFKDTAPVMEKPLAQAAGLGWQGKHTNLVSRESDSWLFFSAAEIPPSDAETDARGSCGLP